MVGFKLKFDNNLVFEELIKNNTHTHFGRSYIYIKRSDSNNRLIIILNAYKQENRFMALKSFIEHSDDDLLFLNNPENSWYLDKEESYSKILPTYLNLYASEQIFFYGSSMGGYGAILFALMFNANAIVINPQINLDLTYDRAWEELQNDISKISSPKIKLEKYCVSNWKDSVIYIMHGHDDIDTANTDIFFKAKPPSKKVITHTIDCDEHINYLFKDVTKFNEILNIVAQFRNLDVIVDEPKSIIKKTRRIKRNLQVEEDPIRDLFLNNSCGVLWDQRKDYEEIGEIVKFINIGLYLESGKLSGGVCQFDGLCWNLLSPIISNAHNLLSNNQFFSDTKPTVIENNIKLINSWWFRVNNESTVSMFMENERMCIDITSITTNNLYVSVSPDLNTILKDLLKLNRYFTFTVEVLVDNGQIHSQIGGVSSSGYFHKNSKTAQNLIWDKLTVCELFSDIKEHDEAIFCRLIIGRDLKTKKIKIKNPILINGFFPMGVKLC